MGFRFHKAFKLIPGIRLNLSKSGPSLSVGEKGMTYNIGRKGTRTTVGLPGTGLSYTSFKSFGAGKLIWIVIIALVAYAATYR